MEYIGESSSIFKNASWPKYDQSLIIDETREIVLQVNGKIRDKIVLSKGTDEDILKEIALKITKLCKI